MDAGVERVLHDWTNGAVSDIKNQLSQYEPVNGSVLPYHDADFYSQQVEEKPFTYFRLLVPMWDNTARYGREAFLLHGSTPACFSHWLNRAIDYSRSTLPEDKRFIIVNAWNEWAEGAHLDVRDSRYGFSYLNSVGRALSGISLSQELNVNAEVPKNLVLHIAIPESIASQFKIDRQLKSRFFRCLTSSTVFQICKISFDREDFIEEYPSAYIGDPGDADFIIDFRRAVLFGVDVLEKMLKTALACPNSVILANTYGGRIEILN